MLLLLLALAGDPILVEWTVPASCPARDAMERDVQALLGPETSTRDRATARVEADSDGFVASIELETERGTTRRSVRGMNCEAVAAAVAVIIAVGVDPIAVADTVAEATTDRSEAPAIARPAPAAIVTTAPPRGPPRVDPRRRSSLRLGAMLSGGAAIGLLPEVRAALDGGLAIGWGSLRIAAEVHHEFARTFAHPEAPSAGARVSLTAGRVGACWSPARARFRFPLCLGPEVGALTARGRGLDRSKTVHRPWAALVPELGATWFPSPVIGIGLRGQAVLSLTRARLVIEDFDTDLLHVGAVGARIALTIELDLFDEDRRSRRRTPTNPR
jgi:hypothetical protein